MGWLFLVGAILFEVSGTLSLRMATHGKAVWYVPVGIGYVVAFTLLAFALGAGVPLGVAYGIWAAAGVALTAVASRILFKEALTWLMGLGIVLIVGGVLLIELGH
ncbi:multidrug efflux SMR transporter [Herbiconiux sp. P15]|uniref:DMT family transporter n=1 Tax=Herbiconiux liukaitaii TaxID=3342799 RepID=UPI0035BB0FE3